jgi:hypothetical protein
LARVKASAARARTVRAEAGDHIEIGPGATFRDAVVGKEVDGVEGQDHHPGAGDHIEIGKGGTFEGPVTGKRVGGR